MELLEDSFAVLVILVSHILRQAISTPEYKVASLSRTLATAVVLYEMSKLLSTSHV